MMLLFLRHDNEPLDRVTFDEMRLNDFINVFWLFRVVPNALGIDDHQRAGPAKAQATGIRHADIGELLGVELLRQSVPQRFRAVFDTAAARMSRRAFRVARKHMILKYHWQIERHTRIPIEFA